MRSYFIALSIFVVVAIATIVLLRPKPCTDPLQLSVRHVDRKIILVPVMVGKIVINQTRVIHAHDVGVFSCKEGYVVEKRIEAAVQ